MEDKLTEEQMKQAEQFATSLVSQLEINSDPEDALKAVIQRQQHVSHLLFTADDRIYLGSDGIPCRKAFISFDLSLDAAQMVSVSAEKVEEWKMEAVADQVRSALLKQLKQLNDYKRQKTSEWMQLGHDMATGNVINGDGDGNQAN